MSMAVLLVCWLQRPPTYPVYRQSTRLQQRRLHRQVVLVAKVARLLAADDPGHVGRVGDVAGVLGKGNVLVAALRYVAARLRLKPRVAAGLSSG